MLKLPLDLTAWVSPTDLISWIQEEVKQKAGSGLTSSQSMLALDNPMLPLLAFAYSRGIYDHEEIAELCHSDPLFQNLSGGVVSSAELLTFRHRERDLLIKVIAQVLIKAARQKLNLVDPTLPPELRLQLHQDAVDRLDNARHLDRGEEA